MERVKFESFRSLRKIAGLVLSILFMSTVLMACSKDEEVGPNEPSGTTNPTAKEVIKSMSAGFNLGNVFDNGIKSSSPSTLTPIIDLYHNAGMKHVRIPVTWMEPNSKLTGGTLADENGNVNFQHARFVELKTVIDYAISLDMYVVINAHHEHWLKDYYDGTSKYDTPFGNLWSNIATYFKDYDYHLIFEVLNEPEGKLGEWNKTAEGFPQPNSTTAINYTRQVNKVGYDAIRAAAGGINTTRVIMVSTNGQGSSGMIDEIYPSKSTLPGAGTDNYLAIQVHSYDPWSFCGQTGSNSSYPGNASVQGAIQTVANHAEYINVPVNYGEFGVGRESNTSERNTDLVRGYYQTFARKVLLENMSYSVWDDRGWFGLVSESGGNYSFTNNIVPFMLQ